MAEEGGDDVDPVTTAALSALGKGLDPAAKEAAAVGGSLARNLFGPVTEELGLILRDRVHNRYVVEVVRRAEQKQRERGSTEGSIPLRAAKGVLEAAEVADNEFVTEYLSGVLASARTPTGIDDSAVGWTALIGRLSSAQLRLHYGFCMVFRAVFAGEDRDDMSRLLSKEIAIPEDVIATYMGDQWHPAKTLEALYGLLAESLVGTRLVHGEAEFVSNAFGRTHELPDGHYGWWVVTLTTRSLGLFLHAFGYGDQWIAKILDPDLKCNFSDDSVDVGVLTGFNLGDLPPVTAG